jgi:hypothetical protein
MSPRPSGCEDQMPILFGEAVSEDSVSGGERRYMNVVFAFALPGQ